MNTCAASGKIRHQTKGAAWSHARSLQENKHASVDVKPYRCRSCKGWHVGHSQASLSFRIREARRKGIA